MHVVEKFNKLSRIKREWANEGRAYDENDLANEMGLPLEKIKELESYGKDPISLDMEIGDEGDGSEFGNYIADSDAIDPLQAAEHDAKKQAVAAILYGLNERERAIIEARMGFGDDRPQTLDEIGQRYGLSRERIRQLERVAFNKLQTPEVLEYLQDFKP